MRRIQWGMLIFGMMFVGCSTAPVSERPTWVMKGSGAFKKDPKTLYGVGIAETMKPESLRRETADNRAMLEVSKQLSTVSSALMRDYMASSAIPEKDRSNSEQYVERVAKTFTDNTLVGVKIIDRWDNGKVTYSLATLSFEDLKVMTDQVKELDEGVKEYIKQNADKAFELLNQEQEKTKE